MTDEPSMIFTRDTLLSQLIRVRPLSIEVLEDISGSRYINHTDAPISDFCRKEAIGETELLERFTHLGKVSSGTDWNSRPLCHLIDHLTENHREFRERDLPAIQELFLRQEFPPDLDGYLLKLVYNKFCAFKEDLAWHMDEEERVIFPEILKTEACYIHPDLFPDNRNGLSRFFTPKRWESPQEKLKHMISILLDNIRERTSYHSGSSPTSELGFQMESLKAAFFRHADLETKVLYPRAIRLEKDLLDRIAKNATRR